MTQGSAIKSDDSASDHGVDINTNPATPIKAKDNNASPSQRSSHEEWKVLDPIHTDSDVLSQRWAALFFAMNPSRAYIERLFSDDRVSKIDNITMT